MNGGCGPTAPIGSPPRWRELGIPDLPARLAGLDASPLGSLLLAVFRARASRLAASDIRAAHDGRAIHHPSSVEARLLHRADAGALDAATGFEALDPSPVVPLGACSALSGIDPNNVLLALRGAEVLADPTVAFALGGGAAPARAGRAPGGPLRLCCSARLVRLQPVAPPFVPHFRLFALGSAGRDLGGNRFELDELGEHDSTWLRWAGALRSAGFRAQPGRR